MPKFRIKTTCEATVTETWEVEAANIDLAKRALVDGDHSNVEAVHFICEDVDDEHDRNVVSWEKIAP